MKVDRIFWSSHEKGVSMALVIKPVAFPVEKFVATGCRLDEKEHDNFNDKLKIINPESVDFLHCLLESETDIMGAEKLRRLRSLAGGCTARALFMLCGLIGKRMVRPVWSKGCVNCEG